VNLGKAIDQLLKIEPQLSDKLIPIRDKYRMRPRSSKTYWKELLSVMNSEPIRQHPKWSALRQVFFPKPKARSSKPLYTFNEIGADDVIIGSIPENFADRLRRYDRKTIRMAKENTEAEMTGDQATLAKLYRQNALRDIELKRLWVLLKDHFQLWDKNLGNASIRRKGPLLVLTYQRPQNQTNQVHPGSVMFQTPFGAVQTNPAVLRQILKLLGLPPLPGMEEDDNE